MAECHPVGFQWVVEARERGATVIHVDPRFTRTSALADIHVPIRAGTDIAFLGGLVNHVLENQLDFREYVVAYTNAASIVSEDFRDTEDLDGLFSGWDAEHRRYDRASWQYQGMAQDPTLQHPRCVYQILKRHFRRYTPEMVARTCGIPESQFRRVADAITRNSGRERTTAFAYSVGWTQHSVGVQYIRTAAILQLLLGNIGRPGGGILALRGHAGIQGSTDIPTLYDLLPGYLPMPRANHDPSFAAAVEGTRIKGGYWGHSDAYLASLLRAWFGAAANPQSDWLYPELPRITGDHSHYQWVMTMLDGAVKGYFVLGENPSVGSSNGRLQRLALPRLDWLVVRDLAMIETATFWKDSPEIETGELRTEDIATEVFFLPAASHTEKDGSFTNTQRLLQWHHTAVEPEGDCRSDLWFTYHLGRLVRERLAGSTQPRDRLVRQMTWDYPVHGAIGEPDAEAVLHEIGGKGGDGTPLGAATELRADGSTSCGCWIYAGVTAAGVNQAARRRPGSEQSWVAPEWGWAWPANRRLLYNRASADPQGRPWSERKRYLEWDAEQQRWTGPDVPDFAPDKPPGYVPPVGAQAEDALSGAEPFTMQSDGRAWLYVPEGLADGPLPAHYEPHESPVRNPLYAQQSNPAREWRPRRGVNEDNQPPDQPDGGVFPFVLTTYRLTEHHTAGGMSRFLPYLAELQPEPFCEVSPELAAIRGLHNGGWATLVTARSAIEARVLVTDRIPPLRVDGGVIHQVGLPYHWGGAGISTGDSANDLVHVTTEPNVHIQESKVITCDVVAGRRPRGPALRQLVESYRERARARGQGEASP